MANITLQTILPKSLLRLHELIAPYRKEQILQNMCLVPEIIGLHLR